MANDQKSMPASEIHKWLDRIEARIGKEDAAVLHKELDEIFQYKPVDNHYFYVRGKVYLEEGKYGKVDETLAAKSHWGMPCPYAPLLAELLYENRVKSGTKNLTRFAAIGYYACKGALSGWNQGREVHYHDDFFKMAEKVYLEEMAEKERLETALAEENDEGNIRELSAKVAECYWNLWRPMQSVAAKMAATPKGQAVRTPAFNQYVEARLVNDPNLGYFVRQALACRDSDSKFLLIVSEENRTEQYAMARMLRTIGCKCILLESPIMIEIEQPVDIRETVEVSLSNAEEKDGMEIIHPCALYLNEEFFGDNTAEIVHVLLKRTKDAYLDVIGSRYIFTKEGFYNLTEYKGEILQDDLCFGYAGDYAAYLSRIFLYDYKERLGTKSKCRFSIIIPARNSAYTLQYTLKTCLNQRGVDPEEYEIIISDNSDNGNTEIENLVKSLDDARIKYYKTPVALPLAKSFEYAYGMAEGEYIMALGSDDGLLPWCLETLKIMAGKYPEHKIIGWGRGFFNWTQSKFSERGMLAIPDCFKKGVYNDQVYNCHSVLKEMTDQDGSPIYTAPLMYINSVCKREFLNELIEKTGSLLDSYTQDVAFGIKSLLFAKEFVHLNYSLSLAGMSDSSLGAKMIVEAVSDAEVQNRMLTSTERGMGNTVIKTESPFWAVTTTEGMFWSEIFRLAGNRTCREILDRILEGHDWEKTFVNLTVQQKVGDVGCFLFYEKIRYNAYCIGEEFGKWYDEKVYHVVLNGTNRQVQKSAPPAAYATGFVLQRGLLLDAAKFHVNTIDEAAELFANIVGL